MCTCEKCKWWIPTSDGNGICDFVNIIDPGEPLAAFEIFVDVDDDQGLDYYLITGPNFGCVHGEIE